MAKKKKPKPFRPEPTQLAFSSRGVPLCPKRDCGKEMALVNSAAFVCLEGHGRLHPASLLNADPARRCAKYSARQAGLVIEPSVPSDTIAEPLRELARKKKTWSQ